MSKNIQQYWIFIIFACHLLFFGPQLIAQEVYFAEDPPMFLSSNQKSITNFIVEYSAKNNGLIDLELWQGEKKMVRKSTFMVKKRGSNTARMILKINDSTVPLTAGTNYEYRLTLFEYSKSEKSKTTTNTNRMGLSSSFANAAATALKQVGESIIVRDVKVE